MKLNVTKMMRNAKEAMSDGAFQQAGSALSDAQNIVREEIKKRTSADIINIINKLQSNDSLSIDEISLMKAWIVGDATGYIRMENNIHDWIDEYDRLKNSLVDYENKDCSSEDLLNLSGILEDATRVTYDIANFLEKKIELTNLNLLLGTV